MTSSDLPDAGALRSALDTLIKKALAGGADAADAVASHSQSIGITVREEKLEDVDNSENRELGLRVLIGQRQACVSSSDFSEDSLDQLAQRAVAMAKLAPVDPYCGLAPTDKLATSTRELDLHDATQMDPDQLLARAQRVEDAARSVDNIRQVEGASASWGETTRYLMTSGGFDAGWRGTSHGLSALAIAVKDGQMERDYDVKGARFLSDLPDPEAVGLKASHRAVARLGARQIKSAAMPVVFDRRVAKALVSACLGAVSGTSIARGTSFLKDKLGEEIFPADITIIDDPARIRGIASRPWDGEGVLAEPLNIIEDGTLKTWLLNTSVARQLDLQTTGHASRGFSSPPGISATNTYIAAGDRTPEELVKLAGTGLLITDMFGPSLNPNTGDYSIGVSGFKIEKGQKAFPVSEVTVAGNLLDMYKTVIAANDLEFTSDTVSPSLLIESMTVAGLS